MENFVIESNNKKIKVNGVELDLIFDSNEFTKKILELADALHEYVDKRSLDNVDGISSSIDTLFGEKTCFKIFGCDKPAIWKLEPFISYIHTFVNEFQENRLSKLEEKYGAERLGE